MKISELLHDAGFVGALIGAAVGFVGAVIGGALSYLGVLRQYRKQYDDKNRDVLRAVLIEICQNQASLLRDLDRALPDWLARSHINTLRWRKLKEEIISQTAIYSTIVYDHLFSELIASRFGSELKTYYGRLAWLNSNTKNIDNFDVEHQFDDYIFAMAMAIQAADDLVKAINRDTAKSAPPSWGKNLDMKSFMEFSEHSLFVAALAWTNSGEIRRFVETGEKPGSFPEILARSPKFRLEQWV